MLFGSGHLAAALSASVVSASHYSRSDTISPDVIDSIIDATSPVVDRSLLDLDVTSSSDTLSATVNLDLDLTGPLVDGYTLPAHLSSL
jgi:hypothetical protein